MCEIFTRLSYSQKGNKELLWTLHILFTTDTVSVRPLLEDLHPVPLDAFEFQRTWNLAYLE